MFTQLSNPVKATIFYALAFTMAFLLALFGQGMGDIIRLVTMFTSLVAVLLMLLVVTRDGYTRAGWEMLGLHHLGLRSWPVAIGGPMLVLGTTYGIIWAVGVGRLSPSGTGGPIDFAFVMNFLLGFAIGLVAAIAEEIGWRGYLLSNLLPTENRAQANNSQGRLRALLLSGFLQGLWHLPLMLLTPFYHADGNRFIVVTLFLLTLTAAGIFYGYLRLVSESTWPAAIAHNVFNTIWETLSRNTVTACIAPAAQLPSGRKWHPYTDRGRRFQRMAGLSIAAQVTGGSNRKSACQPTPT